MVVRIELRAYRSLRQTEGARTFCPQRSPAVDPRRSARERLAVEDRALALQVLLAHVPSDIIQEVLHGLTLLCDLGPVVSEGSRCSRGPVEVLTKPLVRGVGSVKQLTRCSHLLG